MIRAWLVRCALGAGVLAVALGGAASVQAASDNNYTVTPLVSDQPGVAPTTDPNLVNSWGLVSSPTGSPWWVSDNGTGVSTLYTGTGQIVPLVVNIGADSAPTGVVFNTTTSGFELAPGVPARFIFDGEDGVIRAWNPSIAPFDAVVPPGIGNPPGQQIYKGLAIAGGLLFAADFHNDVVDVFNSSWQLVNQFTDRRAVPNGYAPFGIQAINGLVFVTFAKQDDEREDDVAGPGLGFVDAFDTSGHLVAHVAQHGLLNSPWGLAMAPSNFGPFSGDLLVGNFGDGTINVFRQGSSPALWVPFGRLQSGGSSIVIDGLWALEFGTGGSAGPPTTLFFTAGPDGESHGLFGSITAG